MKSTVLWALAVLNVILLVSFINQATAPNAAHAQAKGRPADYLMIPGEVVGGNQSVIYILDTTNAQLGAMALNDGRSPWRLDAMPPIDLNNMIDAGTPVKKPAKHN